MHLSLPRGQHGRREALEGSSGTCELRQPGHVPWMPWSNGSLVQLVDGLRVDVI